MVTRNGPLFLCVLLTWPRLFGGSLPQPLLFHPASPSPVQCPPASRPRVDWATSNNLHPQPLVAFIRVFHVLFFSSRAAARCGPPMKLHRVIAQSVRFSRANCKVSETEFRGAGRFEKGSRGWSEPCIGFRAKTLKCSPWRYSSFAQIRTAPLRSARANVRSYSWCKY